VIIDIRNERRSSVADPITVGVLVAGALSLGGEAVKTAVGEVVKDAYKALKAKLAGWPQAMWLSWKGRQALMHGRR
jgi:hypothetical protein